MNGNTIYYATNLFDLFHNSYRVGPQNITTDGGCIEDRERTE